MALGADDLFTARQEAVEHGDRVLAARIDTTLAAVALYTGSADGALEVLDQARPHLRGADLARLETQRGLIKHRTGDLGAAERDYAAARRRFAGTRRPRRTGPAPRSTSGSCTPSVVTCSGPRRCSPRRPRSPVVPGRAADRRARATTSATRARRAGQLSGGDRRPRPPPRPQYRALRPIGPRCARPGRPSRSPAPRATFSPRRSMPQTMRSKACARTATRPISPTTPCSPPGAGLPPDSSTGARAAAEESVMLLRRQHRSASLGAGRVRPGRDRGDGEADRGDRRGAVGRLTSARAVRVVERGDGGTGTGRTAVPRRGRDRPGG